MIPLSHSMTADTLFQSFVCAWIPGCATTRESDCSDTGREAPTPREGCGLPVSHLISEADCELGRKFAGEARRFAEVEVAKRFQNQPFTVVWFTIWDGIRMM
ncbi:hypothetical protein KACC15558_24040 [Brevibacterium ammoniilyticum]|uniref:Uncharacterized protein n=1 Tax=Brevibacterium ammoniilyticum TaxID=1046555 RepID=A0ABP9U555_9MICO